MEKCAFAEPRGRVYQMQVSACLFPTRPVEKPMPGNSAVELGPGEEPQGGLCRLKQAFDDKLSARC